MTLSRRQFNRGASALAASTALVGGGRAFAQAYPTQDVHFISGSAAGSGADVIVRYFAEKMRPLMGRTIVVENRVGALGNIAAEHTARSKPDGHTIFITGANALASNVHMLKPPGRGPEMLQIVATINRATMIIAVHPDSPIKTVAELTAALKAKGDKASYAISNPTAKVMGAMYKARAGLDAVEVSYKAGADYLNDLASGTIDYAVTDNILGMAQARQGKMRLLAVGSGERMQSASDLPTLTEAGYQMDVRSWWAAAVPIATPKPIVEQLNAWFNQIVGSDETKVFLNNIASDPWVTKPDEAQAFLHRQVKDWAEYVRIAKLEPQ